MGYPVYVIMIYSQWHQCNEQIDIFWFNNDTQWANTHVIGSCTPQSLHSPAVSSAKYHNIIRITPINT